MQAHVVKTIFRERNLETLEQQQQVAECKVWFKGKTKQTEKQTRKTLQDCPISVCVPLYKKDRLFIESNKKLKPRAVVKNVMNEREREKEILVVLRETQILHEWVEKERKKKKRMNERVFHFT